MSSLPKLLFRVTRLLQWPEESSLPPGDVAAASGEKWQSAAVEVKPLQS